KVTPELLQLFQKYRLSSARQGDRWRSGEPIVVYSDARIEAYGNILAGGIIPLALGAFSYSHSQLNLELEIGRYCSLSWGMDIIAGDHPMDWVTTSPTTHQPSAIRDSPGDLNDRRVQPYPS